MKIPILDLKRQYRKIKDEIKEKLDEIFESQQFILGKNVQMLEEECALYLNANYAIGCASGTDAILLSLKALDLKRNEGVITTPFTFFATAGAIHNAYGIPFFVDIDEKSFNISPQKLREFLENECEKRGDGVIHKKSGVLIKMMIIVHLYGLPCEMDEIMKIKCEFGLKLIEDSCQAFGAEYRDRKVGTFGETSAFSFFPTKNLGGAGDGGLISTNDENLAKRLKKLRVHGSEKRYIHDEVGFNSRLDEIQAAILRVKLKYLDEWNRKRNEIAKLYIERFRDVDEITVYEHPSYLKHIYHQFVIRAKRRDELKEHLEKKGIGTMIYYPIPLHLQKCFEFLGYKKGDFPVSEEASDEILALPIFPELEENEVSEIVEEIKNFYFRNN